MREVRQVGATSPEQIVELAQFAARMDAPALSTKFAIVAPQDVLYGLGRMFEAYRSLEGPSRKHVAVFRTMEEAMKWLE